MTFSASAVSKKRLDKIESDRQEVQKSASMNIEWIPYEDLKDVAYKTRGGSSSIYTATWTKGNIESCNKETQQFIRCGPRAVILKRITKSNQPNEKFLNEVYF